MHTAKLFDGTLLAEVLAYTGKMKEVTKPDSKLFSEKEVGVMTPIEKTLHSLYHAKFSEYGKVMQTIMKEHGLDAKTDVDVILKKATQEQRDTNLRLLTEAHYLRRWMWDLLHLRFPEYQDITLAIRPGHKVVAGMNENDIFEAYGFASIQIIHVQS